MYSSDPVFQKITETYRSFSPNSAAAFERAKGSLPGGDTRTMTTYRPYPVYFELGEDTRLKDIDGVWREDFLANYGAAAHGHSHPALVSAIQKQGGRGTLLGGPSTAQFEHAELLRGLVPSMERVRYCNSGTEATMWAIRTARAYTGRDVIVKIDGGYHGTHDWSGVNAFITNGETYEPAVDGLARHYIAHGVPADVLRSVVAIPYNDIETATVAMEALRGRVAGVIVEPVLGVAGAVPADEAFLAALKDLCREQEALLIFDECATIRLGPWQVKHRIAPDLSTFSKIIGGGLPIGAFGGRADIMRIYDPSGHDPVYHAGAYSANSLSLAAGIAALENLDEADFDHLTRLGDRLRVGLTNAAASVGIVGRASGEGGMTYFHFLKSAPRNAMEIARSRKGTEDLRALVHLQMLNEGFVTARHGLLCQHVLTQTSAVDAFVEAYGNTLAMLLPYVSRHHPTLLAPAEVEA